MELQLTPEQVFFTDTTRQFLNDKCPASRLRELREDPAGFDRAFWAQGAELGWTSLLVAEEDGGGSISGRGVCDLALVAFEFGRSAAPGPLTAVNAVTMAITRSASKEQKADLLPGLLDGSRIGTWAWAEPRPRDQLGAVGLTAVRRGGQYVLDGSKAPVEAAGSADVFLVTARAEDGGLIQLLVPAGTPGVSVTPMGTLDLTRRYGRVRFDGATVPASAVLGDPAGTPADVERQLQVALVIQLAEMTGAMDRGLELTTDWLFNRYSFGRPLASYQALKHRFADMRAWLEAAHALADAAAGHVQDDDDRAAEYVSAGKSVLGHCALEVLQECVQFHGGIGVTFEHDLHLYLRRAVLDAQLYGTVTEHRERLTSILESRELARA
jgi:alkylation response protein AidB-like acyl-CoA dehydrogenase